MRPPEEVKRDLVRQWLAKADEDLNAAKALLCAIHRHGFNFFNHLRPWVKPQGPPRMGPTLTRRRRPAAASIQSP